MPHIKKEIKTAVLEAVSEAITESTEQLRGELTYLREEIDSLKATVAELQKKKEPVLPTEKPYGAPPDFKGIDFQSALARAIDEKSEREKKRLNVVLVGLPEPTPGLSDEPTPTDEEAVKDLARQMSIPPGNVDKVFRHGRQVATDKPRITKVVFKCADSRSRFLSGLRPLLLSQLPQGETKMPYYVRPDLTHQELESQRELNRQRIALRQQGKDIVIFRGELMERAERDQVRSGARAHGQVSHNDQENL